MFNETNSNIDEEILRFTPAEKRKYIPQKSTSTHIKLEKTINPPIKKKIQNSFPNSTLYN